MTAEPPRLPRARSRSCRQRRRQLVNGAPVTSGTNSGEIALHQGSNVITVTVIAEDGVTTQTYTITVFRPYAQVLTFVARYATIP